MAVGDKTQVGGLASPKSSLVAGPMGKGGELRGFEPRYLGPVPDARRLELSATVFSVTRHFQPATALFHSRAMTGVARQTPFPLADKTNPAGQRNLPSVSGEFSQVGSPLYRLVNEPVVVHGERVATDGEPDAQISHREAGSDDSSPRPTDRTQGTAQWSSRPFGRTDPPVRPRARRANWQTCHGFAFSPAPPDASFRKAQRTARAVALSRRHF